MWLDRFSTHPTPVASPSPRNRSYSPAPRRPDHLSPTSAARPTFGARVSSLSLGLKANSSTSSLTGTTRIPNGSSLKQELTPSADVDDPLNVLEQIVGSSLHEEKNNRDEAGTFRRPDVLSEEVEFGSLSLHEFARDSITSKDGDREYEPNSGDYSVEEYEREKGMFEDLQKSISVCDDVLRSVEMSLTSFQKDLGAVSAEIETLQSRSITLSTRLENRRVVEKLLGPAVEEITIAPAIVKTIAEEPIDEDWIKALSELEKRSKFIESKLKGPGQIRAAADLEPLLDDLINKAVERIRDFLVSQIKALRSPNINAQIIQQQKFLKFKEFHSFLAKHNPLLAEEISQAYINTMRWYYLDHFIRYRQALQKILLFHVDKHDAIGGDQSNQRASKPLQASRDSLSIGRRREILKTINESAITSYLAEEDKSTHYLEVPFRNFHLALVDNASAEYSFLTEFFSSISFQQMSRKFAEIFEPTFNLGASMTKDLIDNSFDCLGLLLCVRLNQHAAFELQRRKVPVADGYVNGINMLLWPKFQLAMDMHCESIRRLAGALSGRSAASTLAFTGGTANSSKQSLAPHYLTQRFGVFLEAILVLSGEAGDDEPLSNSLNRLRGEYEGFLVKASKSSGIDAAKRGKFLGNNYSLIQTIIADTEGKLAQEQKDHFEMMMRAA